MTATRRAVLGAALLPLLPMAARAADAEVTAPIQALDQALLNIMRAGRSTPFAQRYQMLAPVVERAFDLPAILRAAVGLRWNSISPAEQEQLLDVFRKFTVASYVANFDSYSGQQIQLVPSSRTVGPDQVVATQITGGGDSTRIDYVMHRTASGWKAVDVLLNGSISQVAQYRSDWRSSLTSGAGQLIANLQSKVASLSGGAIR